MEEFNLIHRTTIRIPKDKIRIKEINYEDEEDFFVINIDYENILEIIKTEQTPSFVQIFGRALARTRINEDLKSTWTFIPSEDLEKTKNKDTSESLFYQIIKNIKKLIPLQPTAIILWQNKNKVWGLMLREDEEKETFGPYKNFSEAEIKIQQALKEIIE
jgi:ethanolamine utilization protein EutA (predicted chaperonin)